MFFVKVASLSWKGVLKVAYYYERDSNIKTVGKQLPEEPVRPRWVLILNQGPTDFWNYELILSF